MLAFGRRDMAYSNFVIFKAFSLISVGSRLRFSPSKFS
jgi:hypothetical protein